MFTRTPNSSFKPTHTPGRLGSFTYIDQRSSEGLSFALASIQGCILTPSLKSGIIKKSIRSDILAGYSGAHGTLAERRQLVEKAGPSRHDVEREWSATGWLGRHLRPLLTLLTRDSQHADTFHHNLWRIKPVQNIYYRNVFVEKRNHW